MRLFQWPAQVMGVMIVIYEDERRASWPRCKSTGQKFLTAPSFPHSAARALDKWSSSRIFPIQGRATEVQRVILVVYRTMSKVLGAAFHTGYLDNGLEKIVIRGLLKWVMMRCAMVTRRMLKSTRP